MKKVGFILLFILLNLCEINLFAQSCSGNLLTDATGYYGGFEAGNNNFSSGKGQTDYSYGMPSSGTYEIVNYAANAGGGGYLSLPPHSGNFQMLVHTRSVNQEKIWYKTVSVTPGSTYQFCAWIANAKTNPVNGFKINLNINGVTIASKTAVYGWSKICGSYVVPQGINSIQLSITDPDAHTGPSHFLGLDDICFTKSTQATGTIGNLVWNDTDGNGIKNLNEPGIGAINVKLYTDNNSDNLPDGSPIATTITNAQGNYFFTGLTDGRYIASIEIPVGYSSSDLTKASNNPDNNIDNDNNAFRKVNNQLFTNAITLIAGTEPTNDGDGANGNLTLDLALCGNGSIGDFVWNDANGNGIQDNNETGLYGVPVSITYADGTVKTIITDNNGYYYFLNLAPGFYNISFSTPTGYVPSPSNQGGNDDLDSDPINEVVTVNLGVNQSNLTIDAGFFASTGSLTLGNLVWNDINGNGFKEAGEPGIGGISVKLYRDNDGNNIPDGTAIATTITNAQGAYSFTGLLNGKYIVGVIIPTGYGLSNTSIANPDNNIDNDNNGVTIINTSELRSNFITLAAGTEPVNDGDGNNGNLTLDFALMGKSTIGDFIWKDLNANGIQNTGEPGFAGVAVFIKYPDGTSSSTITDVNGKYIFINLGPGTHKITFVAPDGYKFAPSKQGTNDALDSDADVNGNVDVNVVANTINNNIDAGFTSGTLNLGNMVWNDTNGNGIKDFDEPGIGGIQVKLYRDDNSDNLPDGAAIATTVTNTQGIYSFSGLTDGRYIASISIIAGYSPGGQSTGLNPDNDIDNDNNAINRVENEMFTNAITLTAGGEPTNDGDGASGNLTFDLALCGNAYIGDFVWNDLNGNGIQDAGEPGLYGVLVSITYSDGTIRTTQTDNDGIYYFPNVGPGNYPIRFATPANFTPSPAKQGSNINIDSDPVAGLVNVTIVADLNNLTIDAGFTQAQTLKVGNLVFNDINENGLKDANEPGLAGLTVYLYADNNGDNIADGAPINSTITSNTGSYIFTNLTNGKYIVGVVTTTNYSGSLVTANGLNPDNNIDNDNNGVVTVGTEVRSRFITLTAGMEPTNDGDDSNGNLTLDFGLKSIVTGGCTGNLLVNSNGYFGGFEAGGNNITPTTGGSDLYYGLPRNGSYQIVNSVSELGGGGYLNVQPQSGNYFLAAHTSNRTSDRVWYARVAVTPGATYQFCTNVTLLKNLGSGANFIIGLYVNGVSIATGKVTANWSQICGSYTVPAGVNSIEVSIKDPKKGLFFLAIDEICFTQTGTPSGIIGDFVFDDINKNGLQDANEGGISNVLVTLTNSLGIEKTTLSNTNGFYQFTNLSPGNYTVKFTTPAGFTPSPSKQGTNDAIDSDPVNGVVAVTLSANQVNNKIDAGFYRTKCTINQGSCGVGFISYQTNLVKNGNFNLPIMAPAIGNTFSGTTNNDPATSYLFTGGNYKSQSDYKGTGYADQIGGTQNAHSLINTNGVAYVGSFTNQEPVNQLPFPGDPSKGVSSTNSFLFYNGNQFASQASLVWEQTISGLTIGQTYTFRFYASNLMQPVVGTDNYADPMLAIKLDGTSGKVDGNVAFPLTGTSYQLTKSESANNAALNGWKRFEITFVATAFTKNIKILDYASGCVGDVLGLTGIGIETCEKDTDGDCIPDIDDIDDDNDGITDLVESYGYDPLKDCDNDGIQNYKDPTSGCPGLVWIDCNNDGINDLFDFDRDGILNELDLDSDNDGILDVQETRDPNAVDNNKDGMVDGVDLDGDGLLSSADFDDEVFGGPGLTPEDFDRDGKPNYLDLDSDGDGISDLTEATGFMDTDGLANGTDSDGDGVRGDYTIGLKNADTYNGFGARGVVLLDTDGDGNANPYDIDSDDDGITDNIEAQPTCSYVVPSGNDTDEDGLDDAYDTDNNTCIRKAPGITPYDKDNDGTPDIYDLDSDNDGSPDINEGSGKSGNFVTNFADLDDDGLMDQFDIFNIKGATTDFWRNVVHSNMGNDGGFDGPVPAGSNAKLPQSAPGNCITGADRDWRNISILPVILVEFNGNLNNAKTQLSWTVASETNINYYTVERSLDGLNFKALGQVQANGNANTLTNYNFADDLTNLNTSIVYYRLSIAENSGVTKYSNVLQFKIAAKSTINMALHPNPASSNVVVKLNVVKEGIAMLRIMDMYGKIIKLQNIHVSAGLNAIDLNDLAKLAGGNYNIQVIINGEIMNQKLIIAR